MEEVDNVVLYADDDEDDEQKDQLLGGSIGCAVVDSSKDLLQLKMTITYRSMPDRKWKDVHVVSKTGKTTTKNWHFLNIRPVGEEDAMCVSFKGVEWKPAQETEVVEFVYYGSADVRFLAEKSDEMQKWRDMDVYEEVENVGQPWISSRWVLTEKMKGSAMVRKARLCVRGCEEDQSQMKTDSPTCQKESLRLLLLCSSLKAVDITFNGHQERIPTRNATH